MTITIIKAHHDGEHHSGNEGSSCFYFPAVSLKDFAQSCLSSLKHGGGFYGRFARIEVTDKQGPLHAHPGATFVVITAGRGYFLTRKLEYILGPGDMIYVPPGTPHLSVAIPHTTMIEHIVYLGEKHDRQSLIEPHEFDTGN